MTEAIQGGPEFSFFEFLPQSLGSRFKLAGLVTESTGFAPGLTEKEAQDLPWYVFG
jgi:hypothetical protein